LEEKREPQIEDQVEEIRTQEETAGDWLTQLRSSAVEKAEVPETMAEPVEPVDIPDWLRDMGPVDVATRATPGEEQPTMEAPLLEGEALTMPSPAVTGVTERLQELAPAEIPDWLQRVAPPEAAPPAAEATPEETIPAAPTPAFAEVPDWRQEIAPPEAAPPPAVEVAPEETIPAAPTPALAEVPDWLQEMAPSEAAPPPAVEVAPEEAIPAAPTPALAEVPDWLQEITPSEAAPEEAPPIPLTVSIFEEAPPPLPPEPEIRVAEAEGLAHAEIPGWLEAMRPHPEVAKTAAEGEPLETEGLLEGLRGILPPTSAIERPAVRESRRAAAATPAEISEASLARAQLLQSLLARPAEAPQPKARKRDISTGERAQRWLVAAVLLIAVGVILVPPTMGLNIPTLTQPVTSSGVTKSYNSIQGVSAGNTVLVAFEYGPSEADELDLVAEPILRHLRDQGAHISIVTTRPERLAVATGLLSHIQVSEEQVTTPHDYRPGDATGVSQLLADAVPPPKLILVLTAQPGPLRWWVEQTYALYGDALPIVAGTSAALEPATSPYLDVSAGQLEGAVNGLRGAAAYETRRGSAGRATQRLDTLAVGHIAVVGLMVLGAAFYAPSGLRRRKK